LRIESTRIQYRFGKAKMFGIYRGISQEAKYLVYQSILPAVAYGMLFTDLSYFLTTVQGLSYEFMGLVVTVMGVSTFAASVPLGVAADRYGRKKMLVIGNVLAGLIIVVFAITTDPAVLLAAAVFEGVSEAAFSASSGALLAEKAEGSSRNSVFALYGFAQSMAYGVGSIAIPGIAVFELLGFTNKTSHTLLFITVAGLSLVSTVILVKVRESKRVRKLQPEVTQAEKRAHKQSRNTLAKYAFTSAIIAFGAGMVVPLMTAWLRLAYGVPDIVSGPILGVTSLFIGVATLAAPILAKRLGLVRAIVLTQAVSTVFMFATPLSSNYGVASSVYTVRAFLMNMASPLSQSMIMGLVDEDVRGAASGVNAALWRLPNALSTFIGAYLMAAGMLALPFFLASLLYVVSISLFWYFFRKTRMLEELTTQRLQ
jgi:MFS family permease